MHLRPGMLRTVFVAVLVLHGLIHLLGVVKGFGLADVTQLHQPISRPMALLWLAAALTTLAAAVLLVAKPDVWWLAGVPAVVLSQAAILTSWQDAKAGTAANVLIAVPVVLSLLDLRAGSLRSRYAHDAAELLAATRAPAPSAPVTEADLAPLPAPVQLWLRRSGVLGKPRTRELVLEFRGRLRAKPDADWMNVTGRQTSLFGPDAARLFFVDGRMVGLPFHGYHHFVGSDAVTYTRNGITVRAELFFDEAGDLVSFASDDRYMSADGKTFERHRWVTPLRDHRDYHGVRIARTGDARWILPGGDLVYGELEMLDVQQGPGHAPSERPAVHLTGAALPAR